MLQVLCTIRNKLPKNNTQQTVIMSPVLAFVLSLSWHLQLLVVHDTLARSSLSVSPHQTLTRHNGQSEPDCLVLWWSIKRRQMEDQTHINNRESRSESIPAIHGTWSASTIVPKRQKTTDTTGGLGFYGRGVGRLDQMVRGWAGGSDNLSLMTLDVSLKSVVVTKQYSH